MPTDQTREDAWRTLGLSEDTRSEALEGAYWRLRAHIEARAEHAEDPAFIEARRAELRSLSVAMGRSEPATNSVPDAAANATTTARASFATPRWLLALCGFAILIWLALALFLWLQRSAAPLAESQPHDAVLGVRARPEGAELVITHAEQAFVVVSGNADGQPHRLEPAHYLMRVSRPDCPDEWTLGVDLRAGDEREFAPRICQGEGQLVIRSNVSQDRVKLDGLDVGSSGEISHRLGVGDHLVEVEKAGFERWSGTVRVAPDESLTLHAELVEKDAGRRAAGGASAPPAPSPTEAEAAPSAPAGQAGAPARPPPPMAGAPAGSDGADARPGATGGSVPRQGSGPPRVRSGRGGSKSWHDGVRQRLLADHDSNRSGGLDTPDEIRAIPCNEWLDIEKSYETGGLAVPMTHLYGFDGSEAPANTLGVTYNMRGYAYDRMKQCGLQTKN